MLPSRMNDAQIMHFQRGSNSIQEMHTLVSPSTLARATLTPLSASQPIATPLLLVFAWEKQTMDVSLELDLSFKLTFWVPHNISFVLQVKSIFSIQNTRSR